MAAAGSAREAIKAVRDLRPPSPQASEEDSLDSEDEEPDEEEGEGEEDVSEPRTPVKGAGTVWALAASALEAAVLRQATWVERPAQGTCTPIPRTRLPLRVVVPWRTPKARRCHRGVVAPSGFRGDLHATCSDDVAS